MDNKGFPRLTAFRAPAGQAPLLVRSLLQAEVGFVDLGRAVERLAWFFLCDFLRRQLAQLISHQTCDQR
jgi:hypothetical protein